MPCAVVFRQTLNKVAVALPVAAVNSYAVSAVAYAAVDNAAIGVDFQHGARFVEGGEVVAPFAVGQRFVRTAQQRYVAQRNAVSAHQIRRVILPRHRSHLTVADKVQRPAENLAYAGGILDGGEVHGVYGIAVTVHVVAEFQHVVYLCLLRLTDVVVVLSIVGGLHCAHHGFALLHRIHAAVLRRAQHDVIFQHHGKPRLGSGKRLIACGNGHRVGKTQ